MGVTHKPRAMRGFLQAKFYTNKYHDNLMNIALNKDHYGFYTVGNSFVTYSKLEAIEQAQIQNKSVKWNFNEHVFAQLDWTKEPTQTLDQLYAQRAHQLREKYDYIVLWYSGGADSTNILNTFVKNRIYLDEIAQFHSYDGEKSWDTYMNAEAKNVSIPNTQALINNDPLYKNCKHRMVDLTNLITDLYSHDNNQFDFIYKANKVLSPNQLSRTYLREKIADYANIIQSGKSLCFIWGLEKPGISTVDNRYCMYFYDMVDHGIGVRTQQLNRDWEHDELFYWSPDAGQLLIKQGHVIMNYLKKTTINDVVEPWFSTSPNRFGYYEINNVRYYLTMHGVHRLIYSDWDHTTFTVGKNKSTIFSDRDIWWLKDYTQPSQRVFYNAIKKVLKTLGPEYQQVTQQETQPRLNIKLLTTPWYFLE